MYIIIWNPDIEILSLESEIMTFIEIESYRTVWNLLGANQQQIWIDRWIQQQKQHINKIKWMLKLKLADLYEK
jgi:hypothetical protein